MAGHPKSNKTLSRPAFPIRAASSGSDRSSSTRAAGEAGPDGALGGGLRRCRWPGEDDGMIAPVDAVRRGEERVQALLAPPPPPKEPERDARIDTPAHQDLFRRHRPVDLVVDAI